MWLQLAFPLIPSGNGYVTQSDQWDRRISFGRHLGKIFPSELKKKEIRKEMQKAGSPHPLPLLSYLGKDIMLGIATVVFTLPSRLLILWNNAKILK